MKITLLSITSLAVSLLISTAATSQTNQSSELKQLRLPNPPTRIEQRTPQLPPGQNGPINLPTRPRLIPLTTINPDQPSIDRNDIDAVIASVRQSVGVDGNLSLRYEDSSQPFSTQDYISEVVETMGVNIAITTRSDRINPNTNQRYGLEPYTNDDRNYLETKRDQYINLSTTELIQSSLQLDPTGRSNRLAVLLYAQKHFPIENNAANALRHQASGLSIFQTVYGGSNESFNNGPRERLAYGAYEENLIPDIDNDGDLDGVTDLGQAVLETLITNNILIDLSHASDESIIDTVAQVRKRVPVIANHTVAQDIPNHQGGSRRRGVGDEAIRAIASTQGVIGLTPLKHFLIGDNTNCTDETLTTEFVRHINYVVDVIEADSRLVGSEYVGFGSDSFVDGWAGSSLWTSCELNSSKRWEQVLRKLATEKQANGNYRYSIDDLKNMAGLNFLRVLKATLPGYSQPQVPSVVARRQPTDALPHYQFDWKDVSVRSSNALPALRFEADDVRYKLFLAGRSEGRHGAQYQPLYSGDTTQSAITVPSLPLRENSYSHYRGVIRAYDVNDPSQYIDSEPFFFSR